MNDATLNSAAANQEAAGLNNSNVPDSVPKRLKYPRLPVGGLGLAPDFTDIKLEVKQPLVGDMCLVHYGSTGKAELMLVNGKPTAE